MSVESQACESLYEALRRAMVEEQIRRRGNFSERVLDAFRRVPRHKFVPAESRGAAYVDQPLPIGDGQTVSQPFMVAIMTEVLKLTGEEKVLEVGTGSGYQAAVLSLLAREVHTAEIHAGHAQTASERLARLGYANVTVHCGDGSRGLPELSPFDAILVTAAAPQVPACLVDQLAIGGRLAIPVGPEREQLLLRLCKRADGTLEENRLTPCRFVPLRGEFGWSVAEWMHP